MISEEATRATPSPGDHALIRKLSYEDSSMAEPGNPGGHVCLAGPGQIPVLGRVHERRRRGSLKLAVPRRNHSAGALRWVW